MLYKIDHIIYIWNINFDQQVIKTHDPNIYILGSIQSEEFNTLTIIFGTYKLIYFKGVRERKWNSILNLKKRVI